MKYKTLSNSRKTGNTVRIGIVELGSRSIRLMIADFNSRSEFTAVKTGTDLHNVKAETVSREEIARLRDKLEALYDVLSAASCDHIMVYGTAIARQIVQQDTQAFPNYFRVLSEEEEALASWAAGFMCVHDRNVEKVVIALDQGGGSAEFVSAHWSGFGMNKIKIDSFEFGNEHVVQKFLSLKKNEFENYITDTVKKASVSLGRHVTDNESSSLFLLGSVATKIAWLKVRSDVNDFYKPHLVNNIPVSISELESAYNNLYRVYRNDPESARAFVDSRAEAALEVVRIISNSYLFATLLRCFPGANVRVSGYGVRHGMAFLIVNNLSGVQRG